MAVIGSSSSGNSSKGIQLVFGSSTSYKPPYKCRVLVHAIGAGGGGGGWVAGILPVGPVPGVKVCGQPVAP